MKDLLNGSLLAVFWGVWDNFQNIQSKITQTQLHKGTFRKITQVEYFMLKIEFFTIIRINC